MTQHKTNYADGLQNVSAHSHILSYRIVMYVLTTIKGVMFQIMTHFFHQSRVFSIVHTQATFNPYTYVFRIILQSSTQCPQFGIRHIFMITVMHNIHYRMKWCVFLQVLFSIFLNELSLAVQTQMYCDSNQKVM